MQYLRHAVGQAGVLYQMRIAYVKERSFLQKMRHTESCQECRHNRRLFLLYDDTTPLCPVVQCFFNVVLRHVKVFCQLP